MIHSAFSESPSLVSKTKKTCLTVKSVDRIDRITSFVKDLIWSWIWVSKLPKYRIYQSYAYNIKQILYAKIKLMSLIVRLWLNEVMMSTEFWSGAEDLLYKSGWKRFKELYSCSFRPRTTSRTTKPLRLCMLGSAANFGLFPSTGYSLYRTGYEKNCAPKLQRNV